MVGGIGTVPSAAPPGIGTKLRRARQDRALSIEETAWRTRIRPDLLRALEGDEFDAIGHQAFVRSHLSSYARFLGIDHLAVVDEFESLQEEPAPSSIEELDRQARVAKKPPRPKWVAAAALSGAVLIAAAAVGVLGGQTERPAGDTGPVASLPGSVLDSTPEDAAAAGRPRGTPALVPAAEARVVLVVEAVADTTVSVLADGRQIFEDTMTAGTRRTFRARGTIEILAANAGTVRLTLNGKDLGTPGESGAVYRARYGPRGRLDA